MSDDMYEAMHMKSGLLAMACERLLASGWMERSDCYRDMADALGKYNQEVLRLTDILSDTASGAVHVCPHCGWNGLTWLWEYEAEMAGEVKIGPDGELVGIVRSEELSTKGRVVYCFACKKGVVLSRETLATDDKNKSEAQKTKAK